MKLQCRGESRESSGNMMAPSSRPAMCSLAFNRYVTPSVPSPLMTVSLARPGACCVAPKNMVLAGAGATSILLPQLPQNRLPVGTSAPQFGQSMLAFSAARPTSQAAPDCGPRDGQERDRQSGGGPVTLERDLLMAATAAARTSALGSF